MSFNPFGSVGFPATLTAIPHFAVSKFHHQHQSGAHHSAQDHHQAGGSFVAIPSAQGLQIAVSTVDASQINGHPPNGHHQMQIQNQMLNTLLGGKQQQGGESVSVKMENAREEQQNHSAAQQQQQQSVADSKTIASQDYNSLNEYLSRFSGPPTFPFQQMYKYPAELVQAVQLGSHQNEEQHNNGMNDSSTHSPEQLPQVL